MKNFKKFIVIIVIILVSCERKSNIDEFIEKYDNTDFSMFKNVHISLRGSDNDGNDLYILSKQDDNSHTYRVKCDGDKVISIDRYARDKNYFTNDEINSLFIDFKKYDFYGLGCDKNNNVYINPFKLGGLPYFLRLQQKSSQQEIRAYNSIYRHYKGNWYINIIYLKD